LRLVCRIGSEAAVADFGPIRQSSG
jgi:hypothetical protein